MITQATFDLLDASLRGAEQSYLNYPYRDRFKLLSHSIRIDPHWSDQKFPQIPTNISWSQPYKFADHPNFEQLIASNDVGIYLMFVRPINMIDDMPQHVMYVGISGEHGSQRPLKERLMDYFYLSKMPLRSNIETMLQLYYSNVYIKYCLTPTLTYNQLEDLETVLHEYYSPKFSRRDFEPETKKAKSAWGI